MAFPPSPSMPALVDSRGGGNPYPQSGFGGGGAIPPPGFGGFPPISQQFPGAGFPPGGGGIGGPPPFAGGGYGGPPPFGAVGFGGPPPPGMAGPQWPGQMGGVPGGWPPPVNGTPYPAFAPNLPQSQAFGNPHGQMDPASWGGPSGFGNGGFHPPPNGYAHPAFPGGGNPGVRLGNPVMDDGGDWPSVHQLRQAGNGTPHPGAGGMGLPGPGMTLSQYDGMRPGSRMSDMSAWSLVSYPSRYPTPTPGQVQGQGGMMLARSASYGGSGGWTRGETRPPGWRPDFRSRSGFGSLLSRPSRRNSFSAGDMSQRAILHQYLRYNSAEPPIHLDLRMDLSQVQIPALGRPVSEWDFTRFVCEPPPPALRLLHTRLPWYIDVKASAPGGVTFGDLFRTLRDMLHSPIAHYDYYNDSLDDTDREKIGRAWAERCAGLVELQQRGVMKIDYLMGRVMFEGLERTRDGFWEIKTRKVDG